MYHIGNIVQLNFQTTDFATYVLIVQHPAGGLGFVSLAAAPDDHPIPIADLERFRCMVICQRDDDRHDEISDLVAREIGQHHHLWTLFDPNARALHDSFLRELNAKFN